MCLSVLLEILQVCDSSAARNPRELVQEICKKNDLRIQTQVQHVVGRYSLVESTVRVYEYQYTLYT